MIVCLRFSFHMQDSLFFLTRHVQHAKKVVSYSPGLVDFAFGQVNSVFNQCPTGKCCFLRNSNNRRTVKSILLIKKLLRLVEMMCG